MNYNYRYRLTPTGNQRETLDYHRDTCRQLYNHALCRLNQIPEDEDTVKQRVRKIRDELPEFKHWWDALTDSYSSCVCDRMPTGILLLTDGLDVAGFTDCAETLGYDSLWVSELWTLDAFVALTRTTEHTDEMVADLGLASRAGAIRDQLGALAGLDVVDEPLVVIPNSVSQSMEARTVEALGPDA
jgi:hypothetical protein